MNPEHQECKTGACRYKSIKLCHSPSRKYGPASNLQTICPHCVPLTPRFLQSHMFDGQVSSKKNKKHIAYFLLYLYVRMFLTVYSIRSGHATFLYIFGWQMGGTGGRINPISRTVPHNDDKFTDKESIVAL